MGPRYTKAIIMLVVGSPVLAAGIIIDNSIEAHTAQSSTVTIARLMIAAGACMVAVGIFICCIILTTNKKEEPTPATDVQLHRVRVTPAHPTQSGRRGVQLVTYSPLPDTQNVPYPQATRFNRNPVINSPSVHFLSNAISNTPNSKNNPHLPGNNPSARVNGSHPPVTSPTQNGGQHSNPPPNVSQNPSVPVTHSQNANVSETKSQRSNTSEAKSQHSNTSAAKSQRSSTSEAKSQRSQSSEGKGHRVTIVEGKSKRATGSEAKTQRSSASEAKVQQSNAPEAKCHRSKKSESKSQCSSSSEAKSQHSNPSSSQSKRSKGSGNPSKRSSTSDNPSAPQHQCISSPQKPSHHRHISSESLIYPVNATDMARLLTAAKKVMDPKAFDDIAKTYSIVYSSSGSNSQAELSASDYPSQGPVSSCSSSTGQLSSQSTGAISLPKQTSDPIPVESSVSLGNSPSAPPYQEQPPEFDPPPYHP